VVGKLVKYLFINYLKEFAHPTSRSTSRSSFTILGSLCASAAKTNKEWWLLRDYTQAEGIMKLGSVDLALSLNDIYDRVNFAEIEEE
jgi:hypothetical protein